MSNNANSSHTLLLQCRGSPAIQILEEKIRSNDPSPDLTRSEIFSRALGYAAEHSFTVEHVNSLAIRLKAFKQQLEVEKYPSSISISLAGSEEERLNGVICRIKEALMLTTVRTQYLLELLFYNYLGQAQKPAVDVSAGNDVVCEEIPQQESATAAEEKLELIESCIRLLKNADPALVRKFRNFLNFNSKGG